MNRLHSTLLVSLAVVISGRTALAAPTIQITTPQDQAFVNATGGGPDLVDVTYQVTGNTCVGVKSTFGIVPYVNGVAVSCAGSGCSCDGTSESCNNITKTITIDTSAFSGCLNTIQLQMSPPPFCSPLCLTPCSTPIFTSTIQVWQDPYKSCTGPADCNKSTVGKPVDVATGKMYHETTDLTIAGPLPIVFFRRYDNQSIYNGPMGFGWQHSYSIRLEPAGTNREVFVDARGRRIYFAKNAQGIWDENRIEHLVLTAPGSPAWRVTDKNQTKFEFDGSGNLTKIVDRNSNSLTFGYTGSNLASITDSFSRSITISYYGTTPDRIHTITAGARTVTYTYDGNGNLTQVDYPDSSFVTYEYMDTDLHNMTAAKDALGKIIESHMYNGSDKVTHTEAEGGNNAYTLAYDSATQTTVTNSLSVNTVYTFNGFSGLVTSSTGPGCASCGGGGESTMLTYDSFLNLTERVDGRGIHIQMTYDGKGNMLTRKDAVGTAVERTWTFTYHPTFNSLATASIPTVGTCGNPNRVVTNTYDGTTGDLMQQQVTGCNGSNPFTFASNYTYDAHGQIKTVNGPRSVVPDDITTYDYFADGDSDANRRGRLMRITNALLQQTNYSGYDLFGNVGGVIDPNNVETDYLYDGRDRVTEIRTLGAIPADDIVTINQYDAVGRLFRVKLPTCVDAGMACAFSTQYGYYDGVNWLRQVQDAAGNKVISTYDTEGNRTRDEFQDSLAAVQRFTNFAYDSFNRLQYVFYNAIVPENPGSIFSKFTYDGNGNRLSHRDPEGHTATFTYDELDRQETVTQTAGLDTLVTTYGYDRLDSVTSVREPNSSGPGSFETIFQNGDLGWRLSMTSPDSGITTYSYDPAGNFMSSLNANGVMINRTYDSLNRPLLTSYPDASLNVTMSYDSGAVSFGIGRRTGMTDASGSSIYHYDRRGLPAIEAKTISGTTFTTQYGFDKNGNRTQILYPTDDPLLRQGQANLSYDLSDRVSSVTAKVNGATTTVANAFSHKPFGPRTSMTFGNGLADSRSYDSRYQLGSWTLGGLLNYSHGFNNDGNLTSRTDNLNAVNNRLFGYDGAHRLTQASGPWGGGTACPGGVTYTYDKDGNRLCKGEGAVSTNYTYTPGSSRLASSTGAEPASYSSDSNGNITGDGAHTYQYNSADRLATVDMGNTSDYTFDGEGRRVIRHAGGTTTYYFFDPGGALLTEITPGSTSGKDYVYLGDTPLARVDWSTEQTLGAVLQVTSSTPNVHLDWSSFPPGGNTYVARRKLFSNPSQKTFDGNVIVATPTDPTQSFDDPVLSDANLYLYRVFRRGLSESLVFYHVDHLGTPIGITGSGATFAWRAEMLPFGGIQSLPLSTTQNNLRFSGQYEMAESGLHYNFNRWYDRRTGRYTAPDPAWEFRQFEELNLYLYARGNPVRFDDPSGLKSRVCCKKIPVAGLVGFRHCYVESVSAQGKRTSCGLIGGKFSGEDFATGRIYSDNGFDTGGDCGEWNDGCNADQCVVQRAQTYANPSEYRLLRGPNSNTFAATISRACGLKAPGAVGPGTPGWNDAPAAPKKGHDPEPVTCRLP